MEDEETWTVLPLLGERAPWCLMCLEQSVELTDARTDPIGYFMKRK